MGPLVASLLAHTHTAAVDQLLESAAHLEDPLPIARLAVQIGGEDDTEGPVWVWERVVFGPCTGDLAEASNSRRHRRWTWLSARDGLTIGVCEDQGRFEVRLERSGRQPMPQVDELFLAMPEGDLVLEREGRRWLGDPLQQVSTERQATAFEPTAAARYHEVRDALLAAQELQLTALERIADSIEDPEFEDFTRDSIEADLWMDGPEWLDGTEAFGTLDL